MATRLSTRMAASSVTTRPLIPRPEGRKYRTVLSIDGGGIRGIIPAMVLQHLESSIKEHILANSNTLIPQNHRQSISSTEDFDVDLTDYFDLVAGTSIGSWLAGYIAGRGNGADEIFNDESLKEKYPTMRRGSMETVQIVFREFGEDVFPRRNFFSRAASVARPLYPSDGLVRTLRRAFGDSTFSELETGCLITSFDLDKNVACSFLRDPGANAAAYTVRSAVRETTRTSASDGAAENGAAFSGRAGNWRSDLEITEGANYYVRDIAHASSAAPYYFQPATITTTDGNGEQLTLVDGGMVANNPTLQALTYAPTFTPGGISDVAVFSVGCGTTDPRQSSRRDPGIGWWALSGYLLDIFRDGAAEYVQGVMDYWLYGNLQLPFGQYVRIQRRAQSNTDDGRIFSALDRVDHLPELEELGAQLAKENDEAIRKFVIEFLFATKK